MYFGPIAAFLVGVAVGVFDPRNFLINYAVLALVGFLSLRLVFLIWKVPLRRGVLLHLIGLLALWLSLTVGWTLGLGEIDGDRITVTVTAWFVFTLIGNILLFVPHQRIHTTHEDAALGKYISFSLREMLIAVTIGAALLGIACVNRGFQRTGWTLINDTGRSAQFYESATAAFHERLTAQGYLQAAPQTRSYLLGKNDRLNWYSRMTDDNVPVYVVIKYSRASLYVHVDTLKPVRPIPTRSAQEIEAERVVRDLRQWWREVTSTTGAP
jgi:hypothetical protein